MDLLARQVRKKETGIQGAGGIIFRLVTILAKCTQANTHPYLHLRRAAPIITSSIFRCRPTRPYGFPRRDLSFGTVGK